jgi:hypothetical protein
VRAVPFAVHRIEGQRFHHDRIADRPAGEVDPQVDAFGGRDEHFAASHGSREQAAIGAEQHEREQCAVVAAKCEAERARVGGIDDAQPVAAAGDVEPRPRRAVDEHLVAEIAADQVVGGWRIGPACVAAPVRQREHEVRLSALGAQGRVQRTILTVVDEQHPEQAAMRLSGGQAVRMRVIPVHAGAVGDVERVLILRARRGDAIAVAVIGAVDAQAMPMHDRRRVERVVERDAHRRAALGDEHRVAPFTIAVGDTVGKRHRSADRRGGAHAQRPADRVVAHVAVARGECQRPLERRTVGAEVGRRRCRAVGAGQGTRGGQRGDRRQHAAAWRRIDGHRGGGCRKR